MKRNRKEEQEEAARIHRALKSGNVEDARVNECGDCDFCCTAPAIDADVLSADEAELIGGAKPACVSCKHANNGCTIYEERPTICRQYLCLYAMGQVAARPDKSRVAWTLQTTDDTCQRPVLIMGHCFDIEEVLTIEENLSIIDSGLRSDMVEFVVLRSDKEAWCFMREGQCRKIKIDQTDPIKMRVLAHTEKAARFKMLGEDEVDL